MKLGCKAVPANRSVPAKQASKTLYLLCNLGLVSTAIITSTFIRIVTGKLSMFRIIAAMAKAKFSLCMVLLPPNYLVHGTLFNEGAKFRFGYVHGGFFEVFFAARTFSSRNEMFFTKCIRLTPSTPGN